VIFDKTKARISEQINDRVTAPVRTSVIMSTAAVVIAALALVVAVKNARR